MLADKFRFRFAKTGTLRLLSHHDLMRCFERMLRRADLAFKSTAGFHPTPRVVFALSLPLGVAGLDEVVEIEFAKTYETDEVLARLRAQAPVGLTFTRVAAVPMKATAIPRRMEYRLALPHDRTEDVARRCAVLLAQEKVWVNRLKPSPKQLNIRPYLRDLRVWTVDGGQWTAGEASAYTVHRSPSTVHFDLWVTQTGTARADELLDLLEITDLTDAGAVVERVTVELHDEVPNQDPADVPPAGPAETLPLDPAALAALARREEEHAATARWSASPTEAVVE